MVPQTQRVLSPTHNRNCAKLKRGKRGSVRKLAREFAEKIVSRRLPAEGEVFTIGQLRDLLRRKASSTHKARQQRWNAEYKKTATEEHTPIKFNAEFFEELLGNVLPRVRSAAPLCAALAKKRLAKASSVPASLPLPGKRKRPKPEPPSQSLWQRNEKEMLAKWQRMMNEQSKRSVQ